MNEPFHDPVELLDELDSIAREQELLRLRTVALQARYRALEPHADRFDNTYEGRQSFGAVNIESAVMRLGYAAEELARSRKWTDMARDSAVKVREGSRPDRDFERDCGRGEPLSPGALADDRSSAWGERADSESGWSR